MSCSGLHIVACNQIQIHKDAGLEAFSSQAVIQKVQQKSKILGTELKNVACCKTGIDVQRDKNNLIKDVFTKSMDPQLVFCVA